MITAVVRVSILCTCAKHGDVFGVTDLLSVPYPIDDSACGNYSGLAIASTVSAGCCLLDPLSAC